MNFKKLIKQKLNRMRRYFFHLKNIWKHFSTPGNTFIEGLGVFVLKDEPKRAVGKGLYAVYRCLECETRWAIPRLKEKDGMCCPLCGGFSVRYGEIDEV